MLVHFADAPTIRLIGSPEIDLEEDKDALVLRCVADANPPASIVWRRAGRSEIASLQVSQPAHPLPLTPSLSLSFSLCLSNGILAGRLLASLLFMLQRNFDVSRRIYLKCSRNL